MDSTSQEKKFNDLGSSFQGGRGFSPLWQFSLLNVSKASWGDRSFHLSAVFFIFLLGNFPLKSIGYGLLIFFSMIFSVYKIREIYLIFSSSFSILVLWSLLISSYFWSVVPSATSNVIISQSVFIVFALLLAASNFSVGISGSLKQACKLLLVLVVVFSLVNPGYSLSGFGLRAFYSQKNLLGAMMAVSALAFLFAVSRKKIDFIWATCAIALLISSQSKTSIFLFFVCGFLTLITGRIFDVPKSKSPSVTVKEIASALFMVCLAIVLLFVVVYSDEIIDFLLKTINNELFTGRGRLWLVVIQQVRGDSLFGIGPGVLWQAGGASEIAQTTLYQKDAYWVQRMVSSDGSYIDLFASLGVVGVVVFLFTALDLYRRLFRFWERSDSKLIFSLVTFVLLHGITESTILYSTNILWLIYLLCYFRVAGYGRENLIKATIDTKRPMICG